MRVLSSLLLVFALVSMAGANIVQLMPGVGVTWNPGEGRYEADEGTTISVAISADFDVTGIQVGGIAVTNTDTTVPTQGVSAVGVLHTNMLNHPLGSNAGTLKPGDQGDIVIFQMRGGVNTENPDPAPAGEDLYIFDILAGADGTMITINDVIGPGVGAGDVNPYGPFPLKTTLSESGASADYDLTALDIHIVPEPATVALLGLGTLVLFRKRK